MPGISTRWAVHLFCYGLLALILMSTLGRRARQPYILSQPPRAIEKTSVLRMDCRLDPNVANWSDLACLPEIGPTLARRIVEFRERRRALDNEPFRVVFHAPEDLLAVPGIGPKKLAGIRPYLKLPGLPAALTDRGSSR